MTQKVFDRRRQFRKSLSETDRNKNRVVTESAGARRRFYDVTFDRTGKCREQIAGPRDREDALKSCLTTIGVWVDCLDVAKQLDQVANIVRLLASIASR